MANDSMILRLVGGNVANPVLTSSKISSHDFIAVIRAWDDGDITKVAAIAEFDLDHASDDGDLTVLKDSYVAAKAANLGAQFLDVLEGRLTLARRKRDANGVTDLNGAFDYAIKNTLINGASGVRSLLNTGTVANRFINWASG